MRSTNARALLRILAAFALCGCGCIKAAPAPGSSGSLRDDLKAHVAYLCRPELKGRKTGTRGAHAAAKYISEFYAAYGLAPWGAEKSYAQSFGYGQNIIGVLPGNDPVLKNEIVLVSAHYDHLGKQGGKMYPGASDNAAGVAALLETLRLLESAPAGAPPKRSIAFAAFDSEEQMLFGSFAFSLREDVRNARLVAVVNADLLGRAFMDVVTNTLFVAGTEAYPVLRQQVMQEGAAAGLRVLPLGTDLIGPRSDHVAFESRHVPCVFFTSGTSRDYHQPTDTPEKLNYHELETSTRTLAATVRELANEPRLPVRTEDSPFFREELQTVQTIMAEVNAHREQAGMKPEDAEAFIKLEDQARELLAAGKYDTEARTRLISEATGILAPYFLAFDSGHTPMPPQQQKELALGLRCVQLFYVLHKEQVLNGYRGLVERVLEDRPGPFRSMRRTDYRLYLIDDTDIRVAPGPQEGTSSLDAMANWFTLTAGSTSTKWLVKGFGVSLGLGFEPIHFEGTRQELEDFCLLRMRDLQTDLPAQEQAQKLLAKVQAPSAGKPWVVAIADRLRRGGYADEYDWLAACMSSKNPRLALKALSAPAQDPKTVAAACKVIRDRTARGDVRAAAIRSAAKPPDRNVVLALCDMTDDNAPTVINEEVSALSKDYPFADRPWVQALRPFLEQQPASDPKTPATIGLLARAHLKKLAKRDYGANPARWREWAVSTKPWAHR